MLKPRPPVVVVLGHVDHGKTTLLDFIRKTNITEKEVGGITQVVGAYEVDIDIKGYEIKKITFIDTPGHEAFAKLRLRGADIADIAVLVVDAIDSVMPQTVESIYHIKNAKIPFIVAINKIDLPEANIEKIKKDLAAKDVLVEGAGGDVPVVPISAKKGVGVTKLLEIILFLAQLQEIKYAPDNPVKAYIIESKKDKFGIEASVIIKDGRLRVGDVIYADGQKAKIRALINDKGKNIEEVLPSTPFVTMGFKDLPAVGTFISKEKKAPEKVQSPEKERKKDDIESFFAKSKKKLKVILKTDRQGSQDAVLSSVAENENIEIILAAVSEINKSDIFLAKLSKAVIIGFGITPPKNIKELADGEKVVIKTYNIIYELISELTEVSSLMAEKELKEKTVKGEAKILATFIVDKEKIAGVKVTKGKINLNDQIEIFRDDKLKGKAKIVSLKTRAKDINELKKNEEGGMIFYPQLDFNIGDMVKSHSI